MQLLALALALAMSWLPGAAWSEEGPTPITDDPASWAGHRLYDRGEPGRLFEKVAGFAGSYIIFCGLGSLEYPTDDPAVQARVVDFVVGFSEYGIFTPNRDLHSYQDPESGLYTIPAGVMDEVMALYFENPAFDKAALIQSGTLLPDGSAYTVFLEGSGGGGNYIIDRAWRQDGRLLLTVGAYSDVANDDYNAPVLYCWLEFEVNADASHVRLTRSRVFDVRTESLFP